MKHFYTAKENVYRFFIKSLFDGNGLYELFMNEYRCMGGFDVLGDIL